MDISAFFDHIPHEELLRILSRQIRENDVLEVVKAILKAKVLDENTGDLSENQIGIYQGSSCAPLLSNIYLMDYDREMEKRSSFYIRYSDDILVLEPSEENAGRLFEYSRLYLGKMGLELKESKTRLQRLGREGFTYLGYRFTVNGKAVPAKAVSSLTSRLETMWLTSGLELDKKIKKGQEILGGWEQYYRGERKPDSMIEYVIILSMVQNKEKEIREKIEEQRFAQVNYYKDIAKYMADYWIGREKLSFALREYEQFYQVPEEPGKSGTDKEHDQKYVRFSGELAKCYERLLTEPSDELCADIMQLYTDMGEYEKASCFWEMKVRYSQKSSVDSWADDRKALDMTNLTDNSKAKMDIQEYMELFAGREDIYAVEMPGPGGKRIAEQVMEPLTEEVIRRHLAGEMTVESYVQRPNSTAKYTVFDIDISKRILLQYSYGSAEFTAYKQKAAGFARQLCKVLRRIGLTGYVEDTGFRGYHVWVFFTEWIPVRYINQFTDCVQKELEEEEEDIVLEIFPNNIRVRQGKCGQRIKLPLGIHIRTGQQSFFLDEGMSPVVDYKEFLSGIAQYSLAAIRKILGMYTMDVKEQPGQPELKVADQNLERFGSLPEAVRIVLEKCSLMRYLCQKAATTGYLAHSERLSVLYVFGHMGDEGKEFLHTVMGFTMNYQFDITQRFIDKLPEKPISCVKLREQYKLITAEYGCSCNFKRTKNCYPSPVLHAIKNSGEDQTEITVPVSRTVSRTREEKIYEEINIHKQTEKLAQKIVELKKQRRGLDKSIHKVETELQRIFDSAGIDCLEIEMGMLVRRKQGDGYEWLIEL